MPEQQTAEEAVLENDKSFDSSVENAIPEPEADAKDQESAADSTPAVEDTDDKTSPADSFGSRIKELTDKVRSNKQSSDAQLFEVRQENERLLKELESRPATQEPLKTLEDFEFDDAKHREYLDQRTADIAKTAAESAVGTVENRIRSEQVETDFKSRESTFESEVDDYAAVVYGDGKMTWAASDAMADEIRLSEIGPQLAYHLAKNPDVALELSKLSDRETVRRMTLLESDLKSEKAKVGKTVSDAPPPVPKLPAGNEGLEKDPKEMTDKEFAKWRRKQIASR